MPVLDRRTFLEAAGGAGAASLAGCTGGGDGEDGGATDGQDDGGGTAGTTAASSPTTEERTIGISHHQVGGAWVTAFFEAGVLYCEEQGYNCETFIHEQDAAKQISQTRQMINQDYDGIVLIPWNESLNDVIEEATDAGIPVFTANSDATTPAIKSFTAFGNYGAGVTCAEEMYSALQNERPDKDNYRVLNIRGDFFGVSNRRTDGFVETMDENDDVEIVETVKTDWSRSQSQSKTLQWLTANDPPDAAYASNLTSGLGMFSAFDREGLIVPKGEEGHIVITHLDGGPEANQNIGEGLVDAAVDQPNYFYLPLAIRQMEDWWEGGDETVPKPGDTVTEDDYSFEPVEHKGVQLWSEPIWAPAEVVEKDGHPHVRTNGITITQENADAPFLWGNIWG